MKDWQELVGSDFFVKCLNRNILGRIPLVENLFGHTGCVSQHLEWTLLANGFCGENGNGTWELELADTYSIKRFPAGSWFAAGAGKLTEDLKIKSSGIPLTCRTVFTILSRSIVSVVVGKSAADGQSQEGLP